MSSENRKFRSQDVRDLAEDQHGLITSDELAWAGVPPSTRRRWCLEGRLVRLAPRVYLFPELLDDRSHLTAACLSSPGAVASHRAAANLWNLDGIEVDPVEISISRRTRGGFAVVHRSDDLADFEVVEREGIPCTDATRTLIDLGGVIDEPHLEQALESALRRRLTSLPRLRWRLGQLARPGRPGPPSLRRVLDRRPSNTPPTESELETRFLQLLRAAGVREPVRQHPVKLPDGRTVRLGAFERGRKPSPLDLPPSMRPFGTRRVAGTAKPPAMETTQAGSRPGRLRRRQQPPALVFARHSLLL